MQHCQLLDRLARRFIPCIRYLDIHSSTLATCGASPIIRFDFGFLFFAFFPRRGLCLCRGGKLNATMFHPPVVKSMYDQLACICKQPSPSRCELRIETDDVSIGLPKIATREV